MAACEAPLFSVVDKSESGVDDPVCVTGVSVDPGGLVGGDGNRHDTNSKKEILSSDKCSDLIKDHCSKDSSGATNSYNFSSNAISAS